MFELFNFLLFLIMMVFLNSLIAPTPLSDLGNVRYRTFPIVTVGLILANSLIFMAWQAPNLYQGIQQAIIDPTTGQAMLNEYVRQIYTYGYRSMLMREGLGAGAFVAFSSMFMHSDMWHLLYNMIYLWTFGRRVEDVCGSWRFLAFYLLAGMAAGMGWELTNTAGTDIPSIGASGAIAGVMGAYLILFPGAMIICFWIVGIILRLPVVIVLKAVGVKWVQDAPNWRWTINLPAWVVLIFFILNETLSSLIQFLSQDDIGGVNHAAHVAGFLAALLIFLFVRKDVIGRYLSGRRL